MKFRLTELFDRTAPSYEFQLVEEVVPNKRASKPRLIYKFVSDSSLEYFAKFIKSNLVEIEGKTVYVFVFGFGLDEDDRKIKDDDTVTNRGELFRVMSTIVNIFIDAIKRLDSFTHKTDYALTFVGHAKKEEKESEGFVKSEYKTQRADVYAGYVMKSEAGKYFTIETPEASRTTMIRNNVPLI